MLVDFSLHTLTTGADGSSIPPPTFPNVGPYHGRPIGPAYSLANGVTFASSMPVATSATPSYVVAPGKLPPPLPTQSKTLHSILYE